MAEITLYGIPNCDITRKAIAWLNKKKIGYYFYDYKQQGISKEKLNEWCDKAGLAAIFNKRSTTWRELSGPEQQKATNRQQAIELMMEHTSIIKRPIIENDNNLLVGFNEEQYNKQLK